MLYSLQVSIHPPSSSSPSSSPKPQYWPSCSMSMWRWAMKRNYEMIMCMRRCWRQVLHSLIRMRYRCKHPVDVMRREVMSWLVGVLMAGWSIGWKQKKDLVPTPHTLKGIQYLFLLLSIKIYSHFCHTLGIGIPTFGERRGFCIQIFNWEGWCSCWYSYWIVPQHERHPGHAIIHNDTNWVSARQNISGLPLSRMCLSVQH